MRALCHFDLLRLFGQHFITAQGGMNALGVPYVTTFREAGAYFLLEELCSRIMII